MFQNKILSCVSFEILKTERLEIRKCFFTFYFTIFVDFKVFKLLIFVIVINYYQISDTTDES